MIECKQNSQVIVINDIVRKIYGELYSVLRCNFFLYFYIFVLPRYEF